MNNSAYLQTIAALNKRFQYINQRENYCFSDTWILHSDEVVANFKSDKDLAIITQLRYLETLKHAIYFVAKNRKLADAQIIAYNDYTEILKNQEILKV